MATEQLTFTDTSQQRPLPYPLSLVEARQQHRCYKCGAFPASPWPETDVPYCDDCKRQQAEKWQDG